MTAVLEFWPDYGAGGPLWDDCGRTVDLASLGLADDLHQRLVAWNAGYTEDKLPLEAGGNGPWLDEGQRLLEEVRAALLGRYDVIVHEDWWGEPGSPFPQPK